MIYKNCIYNQKITLNQSNECSNYISNEIIVRNNNDLSCIVIRNKKVIKMISENVIKRKTAMFFQFIKKNIPQFNFNINFFIVRKINYSNDAKIKTKNINMVMHFEIIDGNKDVMFERSLGFQYSNLNCLKKYFNKKIKNLYSLVEKDLSVFINSENTVLEKSKYNLLFPPGNGGVIVHELFGHLLEQRDFGVFSMHSGKKIAPDFITVIDNPKIRNGFGSFRFNDKYVKSKKIILIENGILKNYLTVDMNSRSESVLFKSTSKPSNTYIKSKKTNETIESLKFRADIFIIKTGQGLVCNKTGNFEVEIKESYLKNNVRLNPFYIKGNVFNFLNNISGIAGKTELFSSFCKNISGNIPVSYGQPYLLVNDVYCTLTSCLTKEPI